MNIMDATTTEIQPKLGFDSADLVRARPFLKWAGGKTRLLAALRRYVPQDFGTYFEPFVGGGALFFDLLPERATLSDSNSELIECYKVVRDHPERLIDALQHHRVSASEFYRIRSLNLDKLDAIERAARLIYLNKTCFNGLYRVNRKGAFNTPFGNYKTVRFVDEANLFAVSRALQGVVLKCAAYSDAVLETARSNDFIYFDPPYVPVSAYSDFKRYTAGQFREEDHRILAEVFNELHHRGCHLLLSNSFHSLVADLYKQFKIITVAAPRFINCKGGNRGQVKELLVTNMR